MECQAFSDGLYVSEIDLWDMVFDSMYYIGGKSTFELQDIDEGFIVWTITKTQPIFYCKA